MKKKNKKKTNFPDLIISPPHNHFKHFFSSLLFKIKLLINKFFKKNDKNLELEIVMLKMLLLQKELDFTLLKAQNNIELTVLKNEINQFNLQKIINQK
tara:strand:+ start:7906 stop:8199 length:294 start_codon:yes stop_codon:yes gene_type:complete